MKIPRPALVAGIALAILTLFTFYPVVYNGFVNWDDEANFVLNPNFDALSGSGVLWAFTTGTLGVYQPLAWLLLELQRSFFGLNPAGYHLFSLILYAVSILTLFALIPRLVTAWEPQARHWNPSVLWGAAGLAVGLFAVHPLRVELVAWVSCQPYLPAAICFFLAIHAYLHALERPSAQKKKWLSTSLTLYTAAVLFKSIAFVLPGFLLILDIGMGRLKRSSRRKALEEKIPFVAIAALAAEVAYFFRSRQGNLLMISTDGLWPRVLNSVFGTFYYLQKTLWPKNLTPYYPMSISSSLADIKFAAGAIVFALLTYLSWRSRRKLPLLALAWLAYLVLLSPVVGLIQVGSLLVADRYSFLASLGWVAAAAAAVGTWLSRARGAWKLSALPLL